jgi:hypothetical protein
MPTRTALRTCGFAAAGDSTAAVLALYSTLSTLPPDLIMRSLTALVNGVHHLGDAVALGLGREALHQIDDYEAAARRRQDHPVSEPGSAPRGCWRHKRA